jgi:hypothetical protein
MRHFLISLLGASAALTSSALAQQADRFVLHVGARPDYTTSLGFAHVQGDQANITERSVMGAGCNWTQAEPLTVAASEVVDIREPGAVGGPERFGVLYATTYSALVSYRGGSPAVENHTCVRTTMTTLANSATAPNATTPPAK